MLRDTRLHPDSPEAHVRTVASVALTFADHDGPGDPAMELFHLAAGDASALAAARRGLQAQPSIGTAPETVHQAIVDLGTAELWALVAPRSAAPAPA